MTHPLQARLRAALMAAPAADSAHDVAHADRVYANACQIAGGNRDVDHTVLICASYLHDLVSLPKDAPNRADASRLAAEAALPILQSLELSTPQIENTQHAIIAHSFSAKIPPTTLEAKILQDADRIESLGAIGLARVFAVSGTLNRPLFHGTDPFAENRPLDDGVYAIDHFAVKLLKLPETMQTEGGRKLSEVRAQVLRDYLARLADELGSTPPAW